MQVRWFRPLTRFQANKANHRTHRKVLVVDEEVAFTGGVGIADEWDGDARNEREWRDTHFRIRGPAVDGLRAAFLNNWVETDDALFDATDRPLPRSAAAGLDRHPVRARRLDDGVERHLHAVPRPAAAGAGARPHHDRVLRPRRPAERPARQGRPRAACASRSSCPGRTSTSASCSSPASRSYERLLESGVRIWHFQPSMLHAKIMTVDGVAANIGSANLNARSAKLDEEINLVALDPDLVRVLDAQFDEDLERSERDRRRALGASPADAARAGACGGTLPKRDVTQTRRSAVVPVALVGRSTCRLRCCRRGPGDRRPGARRGRDKRGRAGMPLPARPSSLGSLSLRRPDGLTRGRTAAAPAPR